MQVLDEQKRSKILEAAAHLFAEQPFHKVLLSEVAESASVGKGTLYIYFKSKEDLYLGVLYNGFSQLVESLRRKIESGSHDPLQALETAIDEIVGFAYRNPHLFEVMRKVAWPDAGDRVQWDEKRREMKKLLESIIRHGVAKGIFQDPHPELTARFIPGLVRSAMIEGVESIDPSTLREHIRRFVRAGLGIQSGEPAPTTIFAPLSQGL